MGRCVGPLNIWWQGLDAGEFTYFTWFTDQKRGMSRVRTSSLLDALRELDSALTHKLSQERRMSLTEAQAFVRGSSFYRSTRPEFQKWLSKQFHAMVEMVPFARALSGPMIDLVRDEDLASRLGALLIDEDLALLLQECSPESTVLHVLPPRSCAKVPFMWLGLAGSGVRLGERVDVVHVAPGLGRDWGDVKPPVQQRGGDTLRVVDPIVGDLQLFDELPSEASWCAADGDLSVVQTSGFCRSWLLHALPRCDRFFYVGHVVGPQDRTARAALPLGADEDCRFSHLDKFLTADEMVTGVVGDSGPDGFCWPNRVALIACSSGLDMTNREPFGLVTAMLEGGARLVTATCWPLLTDFLVANVEGLSAVGQEFAQPFAGVAAGVEAAHEASDVCAALGAWQRQKLLAWKAHGRLVDSPLWWSALSTYVAPDRSFPRQPFCPVNGFEGQRRP